MDLPWVSHATHLGHELHEDGSMSMDANMKRASFISSSEDIRHMFKFARPLEVLQLISIYSAHLYGSMLWDIYSNDVEKVFRTWNTCVKLVWGLPRSTHNYFVEHLLAKDVISLRCRVLSQYVGFIQRLGNSTSKEVRILSCVAASDIRSVTGKNCKNLKLEFTDKSLEFSPRKICSLYAVYSVPERDDWRLHLLSSLLDQRQEMDAMGEDHANLDELINSLCYS